jgi:putative ABC transport system substrate-binding protein
MRRREFLGVLGAAAAWPFAGRAEPALPAVGILDSVRTDAVLAFRNGLSETGYTEGRNVTLELRSTEKYEQLPALAAELVRRQVAVIAALGGPSAPAAKAATATIPIVFSVGGDPVEPGGNITGATFFTAQLLQKLVSILHEIAPQATVFGFLVNPTNPRARADIKNVQAAAEILGLKIHVAEASNESDFGTAFGSFIQHNAQAAIVTGDPLFFRAGSKLGALTMRHSLPGITGSSQRSFAEAGGVAMYGASVTDAHRQAGMYAGRILKGEKPGDLPVVQPVKFELILNMKAAQALGLQVPLHLQQLADEVIE